MTDADFEADLERAFRAPAPGANAEALTRAVLARVARTDRRRWLVLAAATALGGVGTAVLFAAAGAPALLRAVVDEVLRLGTSTTVVAWACALLGAAVAGSAAVRAAND